MRVRSIACPNDDVDIPPRSNQHPSEARESIWQNWSKFEAKAQTLVAESGKLANADGRDVKSLAVQAQAVSVA
jgi:cytochrome c556